MSNLSCTSWYQPPDQVDDIACHDSLDWAVLQTYCNCYLLSADLHLWQKHMAQKRRARMSSWQLCRNSQANHTDVALSLLEHGCTTHDHISSHAILKRIRAWIGRWLQGMLNSSPKIVKLDAKPTFRIVAHDKHLLPQETEFIVPAG